MTDDLTIPVNRLLFIRSVAQVRGTSSGSEVLAELLTRLEMPASLLGAKRIASQACGLLRESLCTLPPEQRTKVGEYIRELRWVISHADRLAEFLFYGEQVHQGEQDGECEQERRSEQERQLFLACSGSNPYLRGGAHDHGLCCLLWEQYSRQRPNTGEHLPTLQRPYDVLRREALLSHITALDYWTQLDDWASLEGRAGFIRASMYRRTLAIRHFTMERYTGNATYRNVLQHIPACATREKLRDAMRKIRRNLPESLGTIERRLYEDLGAILCLLRIADDPSSVRFYTQDAEMETDVEHEDPLATSEPDFEVECQDDHGTDTGEVSQDGGKNDEAGGSNVQCVTYTRRRWSAEEKKSCVEAGINPADVLPIQHLHLSTSRNGDGFAWQAMRNQNLTLAWKNLAMEEVAIALQLLEAQAGLGLEELEMFVLATVAVARGLTLPLAQSVHVRGDRPVEVEKLTMFLPTCKSAQSEWLVPAVRIPYQQEHGSYPGCRNVLKSFVLPDYWNIGDLLRRLISVKFPLWKGELLQPFAVASQIRKHTATYDSQLKHALQTADPDRGPGLANRVTFQRLAGVLPERIRNQTAGNLVVMTYATLHQDRTGEDGRFYATPAVHSVQAGDLAATRRIDQELRVIGYNASVDLALKPSSSDGYVGSPMCPTRGALETFLAELVATIAVANALVTARADKQAFIVRHNAFTMLTFCAVTLGTCHRPTHGMIPNLAEIDTATGLVSIVDKGTTKARLGVAAESSLTQLRAYVDYVMNSGLKNLVRERPAPAFFFLGDDWKFLPVSPATLKQHSLPFVANFARHFGKTILSEWCDSDDPRISQEWISALLGHFMEGEEQFGPHSSFEYVRFAESMRAALESLLASVGFRPIDIKGKRLGVYVS